MKKSPIRVIELFVYALILIVAIIWSVSKGGLIKPFNAEPPPAQAQQPYEIQETQQTENPIYNPPPKGEFAP